MAWLVLGTACGAGLVAQGGPSNDSFATATATTAAVATLAGSNVGATAEPDEPAPGIRVGQSVWWRWTPPFSGHAVISTEGSDFDTWLGVFTNAIPATPATLANLEAVGVNDDDDLRSDGSSRLEFEAVGGLDYYVMVDGSINGVITEGEVRLSF